MAKACIRVKTTSYAFCYPKNNQLFLMREHEKQKRGIKRRFLALKRKKKVIFRLNNQEVITQNLTA